MHKITVKMIFINDSMPDAHLGEIPARGGNSSTMRVIDVEPGTKTLWYLINIPKTKKNAHHTIVSQ